MYTPPTYVSFLYAHDCGLKGTLVSLYQLLRGVKHWRVVHVQVIYEDRLYAYNWGETLIGLNVYPHQRHTFQVNNHSEDLHLRAVEYVRDHGSMGLKSLIYNCSCLDFTHHVLSSIPSPDIFLPGQLYEQLLNGLLSTGDSNRGFDPPKD
jgi:hypothetical protein